MTETNNIEAVLKQLTEMSTKQNQLMEVVAKQGEELAKLKEVKAVEPVQPAQPVKPFPVTNKVENPFDETAELLKQQEDMRKAMELEFRSKELINSFDSKYSSYLSKEDLTIVNQTNADEKHKVVEKFTRIFKNESNLDLIPTMLKNEVKQIMELNDTEKAKFNDISKIDTILSTFSEIKDKVDLNNSRFLGNNIPKKETTAESKWKEAIAKANGNIN